MTGRERDRSGAGPTGGGGDPTVRADGGPPGTFVLSLDVELIWGVHDRPYRDDFVPVVRAARRAIPRLAAALDRHRVPATWAVVGHLLEGCGDACAALEGTGGAPLPCRAGLDEALWRLPELAGWLEDAAVDHDVGGHGFWHREPDAGPGGRPRAREEFERAFGAVDRAFRRPVSYVYPRDRVHHPAELARAGFRVARTRPRWWVERAPGPLRRGARFAAEALRATPPPARLEADGGEGPARLSASQQLRPLRGVWAALPAAGRVARAEKGLARAAARGGTCHLWLHPHDLVDADGSADRAQIGRAHV